MTRRGRGLVSRGTQGSAGGRSLRGPGCAGAALCWGAFLRALPSAPWTQRLQPGCGEQHWSLSFFLVVQPSARGPRFSRVCSRLCGVLRGPLPTPCRGLWLPRPPALLALPLPLACAASWTLLRPGAGSASWSPSLWDPVRVARCSVLVPGGRLGGIPGPPSRPEAPSPGSGVSEEAGRAQSPAGLGSSPCRGGCGCRSGPWGGRGGRWAR